MKIIGNRTCPKTLMLLKQRRRSSSTPYFHLAGDELWGASSGGVWIDIIIKRYYKKAGVTEEEWVGWEGLNVVTRE